MSKSIPIALSIVLAQLLAVGALAQTKGEADPAESKGPIVKKATPMEKADARAARKAEGSAAAKADASKKALSKEDTAADSSAKHPAVAKRSAEEKAAARAQRKTSAVEAAKKGEIPKAGEVGVTK